MWYVEVKATASATDLSRAPVRVFGVCQGRSHVSECRARPSLMFCRGLLLFFRFSVHLAALFVVCGWTLVHSPVTEATVSSLFHPCLKVLNSVAIHFILQNIENKQNYRKAQLNSFHVNGQRFLNFIIRLSKKLGHCHFTFQVNFMSNLERCLRTTQ